MTILTYKQAAEELKISLDRFSTLIERPEFAIFRTEAQTVVSKMCKGIPRTYSMWCRGVHFTETFINKFNNFYERIKK